MAKLANSDRRRRQRWRLSADRKRRLSRARCASRLPELLEKRIAAHGITRGQWYFLRVLWIEDGLSQRELSARVGMMEPTTVIALRSMEKAGLIRRVRSSRGQARRRFG